MSACVGDNTGKGSHWPRISKQLTKDVGGGSMLYMNEPRAVLTRAGLLNYIAHLHNIEKGLVFILDHAAELDLSAEDMTLMYKVQELFTHSKWLARVLD